MKILLVLFKIAAALISTIAANAALAQTETPLFTITKVRTGWSDDTFALEVNNSIINPAGCSAPDGYVSNIMSPGYKTHLAAALIAYSLGKQLTVIVSNTECTFSRPKIIGIYLR